MSSPVLVTITILVHKHHGWKPNSISFFFFLSCCSAPLLSFSLCVVCQCHPLHCCHQLAQLVSKRWSHLACFLLFLFTITHMLSKICMCCCGILSSTTNLIFDLSTSIYDNLWVHNSVFICLNFSNWGTCI